MKAQLNFDLDDPYDRMAHKRCVKASDMAILIWTFTYNTKKDFERTADEDPQMDCYKMLDLVFKKWNELLEERGINPDDLTL